MPLWSRRSGGLLRHRAGLSAGEQGWHPLPINEAVGRAGGGVVEEVRVEPGQMVDGGQVLVVLRYA